MSQISLYYYFEGESLIQTGIFVQRNQRSMMRHFRFVPAQQYRIRRLSLYDVNELG